MPSTVAKAKSPKKSPRRPGRTGAPNLKTGNPGNKGGGRKPDAWKQRLQQIVSSDAVLDALEEVLMNPQHPAYVGALKYATDHGYGKATETVVHTGPDDGPIQHHVWMFGSRKVTF